MHPPLGIALCGILILLAGCGQAVEGPSPESTSTPEVIWPVGEWQSSAPDMQGMDTDILEAMLDEIQQQGHGIDGVTVVRNGYLVLDAAIHPYQHGSKHIIHSCTKSIVSALIGIAIEQGFIDGVETPVVDLFPDRTIQDLDPRKRAMTLEHLLTMTSGFRCRDSYLYNWNGLRAMRNSDDWVQYALDLPMEAEPGTQFEYCNSASFLLSAIISETTGMNAREFADLHLFGPLGITDVIWPENPQGINIGWGELRMIPSDLAKIGYLYLQDGEWGDEQIVSRAWVAASTREHVSGTLEDGYGYQWWTDDSGVFMALGYAGQFIFVAPEDELVVVFVSDLTSENFYVPQTLLTDYIIPAARSTDRESDTQAFLLIGGDG